MKENPIEMAEKSPIKEKMEKYRDIYYEELYKKLEEMGGDGKDEVQEVDIGDYTVSVGEDGYFFSRKDSRGGGQMRLGISPAGIELDYNDMEIAYYDLDGSKDKATYNEAILEKKVDKFIELIRAAYDAYKESKDF